MSCSPISPVLLFSIRTLGLGRSIILKFRYAKSVPMTASLASMTVPVRVVVLLISDRSTSKQADASPSKNTSITSKQSVGLALLTVSSASL